MSLATARRALDFIFRHAPPRSDIEIGFFGGEPLLEFPLVQRITALIQQHPSYDPERVRLTLTTNGTVFSDPIAAFLKSHAFKLCVSCDGPPHVQNLFRRNLAGRGTARVVERTLLAAQDALSPVLVNAVYRPESFRHLPEAVDYLAGLGLRHIFLNPDYSAPWTQSDLNDLPEVYRAVADRYTTWYLNDDPHFISLIDTKLSVLIRGGYHPFERCQMGTGELAVAPDGGLYPCERLIGSGRDHAHRIGSVKGGLDLTRLVCRRAPGDHLNSECDECGVKDYCMNWCGCSNAFMSGYYNRVGPFLCASERAAIETALDVFTMLERRLGPVFLHHLAGAPQWNSRLGSRQGDTARNPIPRDLSALAGHDKAGSSKRNEGS